MNRRTSALLLAAAACLVSCSTEEAKTPALADPAPKVDPAEISLPPDSPKLARIQVETVELADVPVGVVTSPGKVEANPNRLSHLVLPVPGRVADVSVRIGDFVKQGQAVLQLESPDVDAAISAHLQAQASVTQARAVLTKAQADSDRARDLFEHSAIAQKEVLNAEALRTQADAAVGQAMASLEQARRRLEILGIQPGQFGQRFAVRAPISGKVLEMNVVPGEFRNDTSNPVMTIADLSSVWVTADVPETSIRLIEMGERIDIELSAYPGEVFRGRVAQIADLVDPQTRTLEVRAQIENRDGRLRPEMFARIRHTESVGKEPVIPAGAVVQEEGRTIVWRQLSKGVFRSTPIHVASRIDGKVVVDSGLKAGDRIVTQGVMLLKEL